MSGRNNNSSNSKAQSLSNQSNNNTEMGHYVVTAHPPGAVLVSLHCHFITPHSNDVLIAKSSRLEVRQYQQQQQDSTNGTASAATPTENELSSSSSSSSSSSLQLLPLVLEVPIHGRIIAMHKIRFVSSSLSSSPQPTDAVFLLLERYHYAVIAYNNNYMTTTTTTAAVTGSNATNVVAAQPQQVYPIRTLASGTLDGSSTTTTAGGGVQHLLSRPCEGGTIVTMDPYYRCIAIHAFDGLLTIIPILHHNYHHPSNSSTTTTITSGITSTSTSTSNKRKGTKSSSTSSSVLGTPFHCRIEESTVLAMTFLYTATTTSNSNSSSSMDPGSSNIVQIAFLYQDARGLQHLITHVVNLQKHQLHLYNSISHLPTTTTATTTTASTTTPTIASTASINNSSNKTSSSQQQQQHEEPSKIRWLKKSMIDGGSSILIPVSFPTSIIAATSTTTASTSTNTTNYHPAVIVVGQRQLTYCSITTTKTIPIPQSLYLSFCSCDPLPHTTTTTDDEYVYNSLPRFLLTNEFGTFYLLSFIVALSPKTATPHFPIVTDIQLEALGTLNVMASSISYIDKGIVYIGSTFGDAQLIQIHNEPIPEVTVEPIIELESAIGEQPDSDVVHNIDDDDDDNIHNDPEMDTADTVVRPKPSSNDSNVLMDTTYISVLEEYTNLGPILDFDLIPTSTTTFQQQQQDDTIVQSQVITASGTSFSGTLRLIRNGIGMYEHACVDIPGIQSMWSLRHTFDAQHDTYLVQSFVGETRILGVMLPSDTMMTNTNEEEGNDNNDNDEDVGATLEEVMIGGLDSTSSTLYIGNVQEGDRILQITPNEIRLLDWSGHIVSTWMNHITIATANEAGQIALSVPGGVLIYLVVEGDDIKKVHEIQLDNEVSCIDIHPFAIHDDDNTDLTANTDMDVDNANAITTTTTTVTKKTTKSSIIAVGLWNDSTVRVLSIDDSLTEVVCIQLGMTDNDDNDVVDQSGTNVSRQNHMNVMARSLCLVTLDCSSSSSNNTSNRRKSIGMCADMLFIGMGDGTLVSFAVVVEQGNISVQSKKEICLGTQRIDLVRLAKEQGGTCLLTTGDRPTVIYLAGVVGSGAYITPKLCYSSIHLESNQEDKSQEYINNHNTAINIATPFYSPLLFNNDTLGTQQYSLSVADDSTLRLGVIDDIQKLHVTTCRLGMAPRRIVHCKDGRLFAVGCIENGTQNMGFNGDEANMGNCIRFLDDTTFDDIDRINLEPYEMILSMMYSPITVPILSEESNASPMNDKPEVHTKRFLFVGTAYAFPDEDEPTRGRILVYACKQDATTNSIGGTLRSITLITEFETEGGVYSMCQFYDGKILVTVNSKTHVCQMIEEVGVIQLQYLGLGHFGHILSLFVKSRAQQERKHTGKMNSLKTLPAPTSTSGESSSEQDFKETPEEMLAIVGDLMRSISLVQFYPQHNTLEEIARDFNANWTCAVEMLTDNVYLGAENWSNLFCLRRNTSSSNEEIRCRLDTIGEYHLGEMCNKFMSGSLIMPVVSKSTSSTAVNYNSNNSRSVRRSGSPHKSNTLDKQQSLNTGLSHKQYRPTVATGSQTLFGTVDGTLGVVLGLDQRTMTFFTSLERAMANVIEHVGNFPHGKYRACHAERRIHPAHGFIDGDFIERFLDLHRPAMEMIVEEMNRDGSWYFESSNPGATIGSGITHTAHNNNKNDSDDVRYILTVEDVLAMVEEMTMLH